MLRKTTLALALAAAVLAAAAFGVARSSAGGAAPTKLVFAEREEPGNFAFDDLGAKSKQGPDIGDVLAFTHTLVAHGRAAGVIHLTAIGVDHRRHLTQATGTVVVADGTIAVSGVVPQSSLFSLAVVGGTGAYAGARGTLTVRTPAHTSTITIALLR
ncbi:MAG TPA: hypothetical protein VGU02_12195 [Gaiellaceae bacterium]|nr:hypothetical protein [Gaiellaceae bacterium]